MKEALTVFKEQMSETISSKSVELVGIELITPKTKDGESESNPYTRLTCEIRRGQGKMSKLRFSVKIETSKFKINQSDLDENEFEVFFKNLLITYIDTAKNQVYFKADDYEVEKIED